jgi:hypothetical protein
MIPSTIQCSTKSDATKEAFLSHWNDLMLFRDSSDKTLPVAIGWMNLQRRLWSLCSRERMKMKEKLRWHPWAGWLFVSAELLGCLSAWPQLLPIQHKRRFAPRRQCAVPKHFMQKMCLQHPLEAGGPLTKSCAYGSVSRSLWQPEQKRMVGLLWATLVWEDKLSCDC